MRANLKLCFLFMLLVEASAFTGSSRAQTSAPIKPNLYFVTVGVSEHQHAGRELRNLRFAAKDARDFAAHLKRQKGGLFDAVHGVSLTDGQASRENIEEALDWLRPRVKASDYVMVFLAGHGDIDSLGHYFFVPHDFKPQRPSSGRRPQWRGLDQSTWRAHRHSQPRRERPHGLCPLPEGPHICWSGLASLRS